MGPNNATVTNTNSSPVEVDLTGGNLAAGASVSVAASGAVTGTSLSFVNTAAVSGGASIGTNGITQSSQNNAGSNISNTNEVIGYGGGDSDEGDKKRKATGQHSYNYDQTSPFQVLGAGELTNYQTEALIKEKGKAVGQ